MGLRPAGRARLPEEAPRGVAPRAALRADDAAEVPGRAPRVEAAPRALQDDRRAVAPLEDAHAREFRGVREAPFLAAPASERVAGAELLHPVAPPLEAPQCAIFRVRPGVRVHRARLERLAPHVGEAYDAAEQRVPAGPRHQGADGPAPLGEEGEAGEAPGLGAPHRVRVEAPAFPRERAPGRVGPPAHDGVEDARGRAPQRGRPRVLRLRLFGGAVFDGRDLGHGRVD